jgi:murein DD-endopeptidase MepM/ murein hydrolase activator NlpD
VATSRPAATEEPVQTIAPVVETRDPAQPYSTPTPDAPHNIPTLRPNAEYYTVQYGDYMAAIALKYAVDLDLLIAANPEIDPNWLAVGQVLTIPAMTSSVRSADFKIIPDSELVYGPTSASLNIGDFLRKHKGYLLDYSEVVDEVTLSGPQIIKRVSYEYSLNPRLLLAVLEYRTGWVTSKNIDQSMLDYPMGRVEVVRKGLYKQLCWIASKLNYGYYGWKDETLSYIPLSNGKLAVLSPTINAGTAAVQYAMGQGQSVESWQKAISEQGVYQTYVSFFGIPFDHASDPVTPVDLKQPKLQLPFEDGVSWSFTGGPHAGWDEGSAWAALDFAPPGDQFGCFFSNAWVTAVADGTIVRTGDGAVIQELDNDNNEGTGWTILYMHIESRDRVAVGTVVKTGDRIGHASCEGGFSSGTHLHLARRYNGEWIAADGSIPFKLSGWKAAGSGIEYDGTLTRDGAVVYAWDGRVDANQIWK